MSSLNKSRKKSYTQQPITKYFRSNRSITKKNIFNMLSNRIPNLKKYLEKVCTKSDKGFCFLFGEQNDKVNAYFENFNKKYKINEKVISRGANGEVTEHIYERDGFKKSVIEKKPLIEDEEYPDNLWYESFVGSYLNKQCRYYPCFMETYKFIIGNDQELIINSKNKSVFSQLKHPNFFCNEIIKKSSLMIEYLHEPITLHNWINTNCIVGKKKEAETKHAFNVELPRILYQIYSVLDSLKKKFTHYDLHTSNVLLYKIPNDGHITMRYHVKDKIIQFNTNYIAKIIDYGRCYIPNSEKIYKQLCKYKECKIKMRDTCGDHWGFNMFDDEANEDNFYISSRLLNQSHDLRLINIIKYTPGKVRTGEPINTDFRIILNNIVYEGEYGTPENLTNDGEHITNVNLLHLKLIEFFKKYETYYKKIDLESYNANNLVGTLDIYLDRSKEIRFTRVTSITISK